MAYEEALVGVNITAGADLSAPAKLYTIGKLNASGGLISASVAGETVVGVLQGTGKVGDPIKVGVAGVSKVKAGAAITAGARVSTDANGAAITAIATHKILGFALATAAPGDIIPVLLTAPGAATF